MDTIQYLLGKVLRLAVIVFIIAIMVWLIRLVFPQASVVTNANPRSAYNSIADFLSFDWLPAPRNYAGLLATRNQSGENGHVYEPGSPYTPNAPYNGYANVTDPGAQVDWTYYTTNGTQIVHGGGTQDTHRLSYLRNLSIYQDMSITNGQTIYGEANASMVKNGVFPIAITDERGNLISSTQGVVMSTWAAPGWVRFQATIRTQLPSGVYCNLVFYSANEPVHLTLPVVCK